MLVSSFQMRISFCDARDATFSYPNLKWSGTVKTMCNQKVNKKRTRNLDLYFYFFTDGLIFITFELILLILPSLSYTRFLFSYQDAQEEQHVLGPSDTMPDSTLHGSLCTVMTV